VQVGQEVGCRLEQPGPVGGLGCPHGKLLFSAHPCCAATHSYHGWEFDGSGACTRVPQIEQGTKVSLAVLGLDGGPALVCCISCAAPPAAAPQPGPTRPARPGWQGCASAAPAACQHGMAGARATKGHRRH